MNARKSNVIYITFIVVTLSVLALFVAYAAVKANAEKSSYTIDMNTGIMMNHYKIKVSDPMYITDKNEFIYALSMIKEPGADDRAEPSPYDFQTFKKGDSKVSYPPEYAFSKRTDMSEYVHITGVIDDYIYVRVFIESVIPEYRDPPTVDEFGDEIEGQLHEEVKKQIYVQIDKKDIKYLTYDEFLKLKPVDSPESIADETSTQPDNDDSKSYDEIDINVSSEEEQSSFFSSSESENVSSVSALTELSSAESSSSESTLSRSEGSTNSTGNSGAGGGNSGGGGGSADERPEETEAQPAETEPPHTETPTTTTTQPPVATTTSTTTTTTTTAATTAEPVTQPVIHVDTISISSDFAGNLISLKVGEHTVIHAVISPENATNKAVKWTSNREDIARVDDDGRITAVGNGKAIITCESEDGGLKASCMVTVSP